MIKDKIGPFPSHSSPYRSYEVKETRTVSRQASPIPVTADETAVPIDTPPILTPFPRMPTPPVPIVSPVPPIEKITSPPPPSPSILPAFSSPPVSPSTVTQDLFSFPQESAFVVDFDKVRRGKFSSLSYLWNRTILSIDLLAAIEERTIPALEEAIQQAKDNNYLQQLKYECERALELLNRLMKIEHMK